MLADLKKTLAQCHIDKNDQVVRSLLEADTNYLLQRAKEEAGKPPTSESLKLQIQLLNIARFKIIKGEKIEAAQSISINMTLPDSSKKKIDQAMKELLQQTIIEQKKIDPLWAPDATTAALMTKAGIPLPEIKPNLDLKVVQTGRTQAEVPNVTQMNRTEPKVDKDQPVKPNPGERPNPKPEDKKPVGQPGQDPGPNKEEIPFTTK